MTKNVVAVEQSVPLNHPGTLEEIAEMTLFLLSNSASFAGESLPCDTSDHLGGSPLTAR